jgi:hypothetical protein
VHGNAADFVEPDVGLLQRFIDYGQEFLQMRSCRHLRNDAAKPSMQIGLRGDHVGQDRRLVRENRRSRFIAGSFDGEKYQDNLAQRRQGAKS